MSTSSLLHRRRPARWCVALVGITLLAGCTGTDTDGARGTTPTPGLTSVAPSPDAEPSATVDAGPPAPVGDGGPEESFRTWLAASRAPDVTTACSYMTPELAQRMVDEISAQGFPGITDCPTLIAMTAGLYAAAGQSSQTAVELREQTADRAVLHVTYVEGRSCGVVVLQPGPGHWVLDERSQEEC